MAYQPKRLSRHRPNAPMRVRIAITMTTSFTIGLSLPRTATTLPVRGPSTPAMASRDAATLSELEQHEQDDPEGRVRSRRSGAAGSALSAPWVKARLLRWRSTRV